jgi:hypothetical protein
MDLCTPRASDGLSAIPDRPRPLENPLPHLPICRGAPGDSFGRRKILAQFFGYLPSYPLVVVKSEGEGAVSILLF